METKQKKQPAKEERTALKRDGRQEERRDAPSAAEILVGRNAVFEALKAGRGINRILVAQGAKEAALAPLLSLAREQGVPVRTCKREKLDQLAPDMRHQGVIAYAAPVAYASIDDVFACAEEKGEPPLLLLLDEIEDPHNFGALLRTADAAGVHGVLVPER
ncbi:RNA methyltransferase, partial [uncultured Selenomonas sp.]|uniref:TrmH family RNA methyltransferase n=1 Tax=uncultured Selenomonas sp. TaxID=159275 RepID=UPI00261DCAA3